MEDPRNTLDYQAREEEVKDRSSSTRLDFALLLIFAIVALLLASVTAVKGAGFLQETTAPEGTAKREEAKENAHRMFAISGVLAMPGLWYGYVALRGLRRGY